MRVILSAAFAFMLAAAFATGISAQTPTAAPTKIGIIDTNAFLDEKAGIKRYIDAYVTLNKEFEPAAKELDALGLKIQNLEKEIAALREQVQKNVPVNQTTVNAKLEEYDKATREFKFKKEGSEASYNRRREAILGPVLEDISKALQDFAKKNGFVLIIDIAKDQNGMLLTLDEKSDATKDFIAFYNARPVTPATR